MKIITLWKRNRSGIEHAAIDDGAGEPEPLRREPPQHQLHHCAVPVGIGASAARLLVRRLHQPQTLPEPIQIVDRVVGGFVAVAHDADDAGHRRHGPADHPGHAVPPPQETPPQRHRR